MLREMIQACQRATHPRADGLARHAAQLESADAGRKRLEDLLAAMWAGGDTGARQ